MLVKRFFGLPAQRHQSGAQKIAEHALRIESQTPVSPIWSRAVRALRGRAARGGRSGERRAELGARPRDRTPPYAVARLTCRLHCDDVAVGQFRGLLVHDAGERGGGGGGPAGGSGVRQKRCRCARVGGGAGGGAGLRAMASGLQGTRVASSARAARSQPRMACSASSTPEQRAGARCGEYVRPRRGGE